MGNGISKPQDVQNQRHVQTTRTPVLSGFCPNVHSSVTYPGPAEYCFSTLIRGFEKKQGSLGAASGKQLACQGRKQASRKPLEADGSVLNWIVAMIA